VNYSCEQKRGERRAVLTSTAGGQLTRAHEGSPLHHTVPDALEAFIIFGSARLPTGVDTSTGGCGVRDHVKPKLWHTKRGQADEERGGTHVGLGNLSDVISFDTIEKNLNAIENIRAYTVKASRIL
jgi:hypothetical protein